MATPFTRAIVIVMDSVGVGELPDAAAYGDQGSNTIGNIAAQIGGEIDQKSLAIRRYGVLLRVGARHHAAGDANREQGRRGPDFQRLPIRR